MAKKIHAVLYYSDLEGTTTGFPEIIGLRSDKKAANTLRAAMVEAFRKQIEDDTDDAAAVADDAYTVFSFSPDSDDLAAVVEAMTGRAMGRAEAIWAERKKFKRYHVLSGVARVAPEIFIQEPHSSTVVEEPFDG